MSIILFIIILLVLVMVHELGHFTVAKLTGCRVDEFSFGFPPTIWKRKWGETEYKLNAIPIGGYVKIWGEDGSNNTDKRVFSNKPKWVQLSVLFAGVMMNWLLAFFIFFAMARGDALMSAHDTTYGDRVVDAKLIILNVDKKSPAYVSGIRSGYSVSRLSADNNVADITDADKVKDFFNKNIDKDIKIEWRHDNDKGVSTVTGVYGIINDKKAIGISFDVIGNIKLGFVESVKYAANNTYVYTKLTVLGLVDLVKGIVAADRQVLDNISGPVGIAKTVGDQAKEGSMSNIFALIAVLSINLAVFNLLPFPALDGGRIIMVIYEALTRKKIKHNISAIINGVGFLLLILLIVIVTINDIFK